VSALIREATAADLSALLRIEQESFSNPHWTAEDFFKHECIVAEVDSQVAGLLVAREICPPGANYPPQREILNLAVAAHFRRRGIATALMNHQLSRTATYFLEVRESNLAAQELYRKFGFIEVARRPSYYQSPVERAIVMKMK
jgi:[ribosomal protein S18]-alanine N-acetyltransferase